MQEFDIKRCTRRCASSDRELEPSEVFYSVLVAEGAEVVRYDYSEEGWNGPPENSIGVWKSRMPDASGKKVDWAPDEVMLDYFQRLETDPSKVDMRYVLALLLIRRRIVRWESTEEHEQGQEVMVLYNPRNEDTYHVLPAAPSAQRAKEIQDELARLLFADAA